MGIYILDDDHERFATLKLKNWEDHRKFFELSANSSFKDLWIPFAIEPSKKKGSDKVLPVSDFQLMLLYPVFSERAVKAFGDMLEGKGELLPLRYEDSNYYLFNVTHVLNDVLDKEKTDFYYFSDGKIMYIRKHAFKETEELRNETIFKISETISTTVFVTERFKRCADENNLTGFMFKES
jgi:hypothetical protein